MPWCGPSDLKSHICLSLDMTLPVRGDDVRRTILRLTLKLTIMFIFRQNPRGLVSNAFCISTNIFNSYCMYMYLLSWSSNILIWTKGILGHSVYIYGLIYMYIYYLCYTVSGKPTSDGVMNQVTVTSRCRIRNSIRGGSRRHEAMKNIEYRMTKGRERNITA